MNDEYLKLKQSYHGNGGKEGYRFKVYNEKGKKLGELKEIPVNCKVGDVVSINGALYKIFAIYDSEKPGEERSEVIYYELSKYVFEAYFDLGEIQE